MKKMDQLNDWEQLLVVIGSNLSWYDWYICRNDIRGLEQMAVSIYMSEDAFDGMVEAEPMLAVVRDALVRSPRGYYEEMLDYAYVELGGDVREYPSVITRFYLRGKDGVGYKVSFDDGKSLEGTMVKRRYLETLN